jgi:hypothetical protein
MPEYYGYKAPEQADFGKSIANVAELFVKAEEKRAAKRETEQKSLDESRKKINEIEQNSNQSQSELVGSGANKTRNYILELERMRKSGQITGAEFNRRMTNVNDSWDNYAFVTKNMNERLAENLKRQQEGLASSNEIFLAKIQSDLMNTKNKDIMVANDGNMYMVDKNDPNKPISFRSGGNIDNIVDNKVDVPTLVQGYVSNFGDFSKETGATTESGARLQKELYDAAKYDIIHSIVDKDNPRGIVSILKDNAGADYVQYYNKEQKDQLLNDAVARQEALKGPMDAEQKAKFRSEYEKNNMIEYVADDNGSFQPVVTDKMIKEAEEYVDRTIEMQVGRTTAEDEDRAARGGGGGDGTQIQEVSSIEQQMIADARAAWKANDPDALRRASNDQYFFAYAPDGGVNVFKTNPQKYRDAVAKYKKEKAAWDKLKAREKENTPEPEAPKAKEAIAENIKGVDGLYPYFFGSGITNMEKWKAELQRQRNAESGGGTTTPPKKKFN